MAASPLIHLPAHILAAKLSAGETTSVELVNAFLDQIDRHNHQGLKLHAVISACPRDVAVKQAQRLDDEREGGRVRSELHGIPVILKDAIVTDLELGMPSTAGAAVFARMKARKSAIVVERMVEAGMIIIAKGNLTEFCGHKSKDTPIGWSVVGGQTLSAFRREDLEDKDQPTAGGSSSGPAVAVTAGFAPLGVGTETAGSTVYPASTNGLYAMKLSRGSVPIDGVFRISESFDGLGPMARDPRDLVALAKVMLDKECVPENGFNQALGEGFQGLGVGVLPRTWGLYEAHKAIWEGPDVVDAWDKAVAKMKMLGATVVYPLDAPSAQDTLSYNGENLMTISYHEFPDVLKTFIDCFQPDPEITSLEDIVEWNQKHPDEAMPQPHTGQTELIACLNNTMPPSTHDAVVPQLRRLAGPDGMERTMQTHGLDVVVSSSHATLVSFAACAGWPIATVPLGRMAKNGQPYGMFALARGRREDVLVRFMMAWHEAFGGVEMPNV